MTTHDRGRPRVAKAPKQAQPEEALQGDVVTDTEAEGLDADAVVIDTDAVVVDADPSPDEFIVDSAAEEVEFTAEDDKAVAAKIAKTASLARRESSSASSQDPLQAYMRDVQRYSLLTPEETHDLAVKYTATGDVEAAKRLVTSNLRLVVKIAFDYRHAYRNLLDLVQEGNIGLMQAVSKYDPNRGVKLSSYAAWWIRAYMLRFILNNARLVKLGTTQAQRKLFFNLRKEKAKLSAMGIDPTSDVIAKRLEVSEEDVISMDRRLSGHEMSLDAPVSDGQEGRSVARVEMLASDGGNIDDALADGELHNMLSEKLHEYGRTLTGKDAIIFNERLIAEDPKTLQELGDKFGVSRERVRQLEKRLQDKIRGYLEANVDIPK